MEVQAPLETEPREEGGAEPHASRKAKAGARTDGGAGGNRKWSGLRQPGEGGARARKPGGGRTGRPAQGGSRLKAPAKRA